MQLYFILFAMVFTYVCVSDPNVLDWINIKVNHMLVDLQLRYIKFKWMFKKF
jgi:hypothetical protein